MSCSYRKSDLLLRFTRIYEIARADVLLFIFFYWIPFVKKRVRNLGQRFSHHPKSYIFQHFSALEQWKHQTWLDPSRVKRGGLTLTRGQEQHGVVFRLVGLVEPKCWCGLVVENKRQFLLCTWFNCGTWKSLVAWREVGSTVTPFGLTWTCISGKMVRVSLPSLQLRKLSVKHLTLFTFLCRV